ncbi:MAG TPA: SDR family oxidoreductase, partial [Gemmatales bacterium]|nr:SDR family oxidoreductase [Gemmatales bacterium]
LDRLQALASELEQQHGITAHPVAVDLNQPHAARQVWDYIVEKQLQPAVLINNAGFGGAGKFHEQDLQTQLDMLQVNVRALMELTGLVLPGMLERKSGRIMNVASTAAYQPGPLMAVYYATKAFVLSFSEALHHENRGTGVTVTCVCPGATRTEFQQAAQMNESRLFNTMWVMDSATVARQGYIAMKQGRRTIVNGRMNNFLAFMNRLSPNWLRLIIAQRMQERKIQ